VATCVALLHNTNRNYSQVSKIPRTVFKPSASMGNAASSFAKKAGAGTSLASGSARKETASKPQAFLVAQERMLEDKKKIL